MKLYATVFLVCTFCPNIFAEKINNDNIIIFSILKSTTTPKNKKLRYWAGLDVIIDKLFLMIPSNFDPGKVATEPTLLRSTGCIAPSITMPEEISRDHGANPFQHCDGAGGQLEGRMDMRRAVRQMRDVIGRFQHVMMDDTEDHCSHHPNRYRIKPDPAVRRPQQYNADQREKHNNDIDEGVLPRGHQYRKVIVRTAVQISDNVMDNNNTSYNSRL